MNNLVLTETIMFRFNLKTLLLVMHTNSIAINSLNIKYFKLGTQNNFNKYGEDDIDTLSLPYDYGSVMHYGAYDFSSNGLPTIIPVRNASAVLGQRIGMSPIDILEVQRYYGCVATPATTTLLLRHPHLQLLLLCTLTYNCYYDTLTIYNNATNNHNYRYYDTLICNNTPINHNYYCDDTLIYNNTTNNHNIDRFKCLSKICCSTSILLHCHPCWKIYHLNIKGQLYLNKTSFPKFSFIRFLMNYYHLIKIN